MERIFIVVSVLPPVENFVANILSLPAGRQFQARGQFFAELERLIAVIPSLESVTSPGGSLRLHRHCARSYKHRIDITAAIRLKGEPIAFFYLRVQRDIRILYAHRRTRRLLEGRIIVPASNTFIRGRRESHIVCRNDSAFDAFLCGAHAACLVQEKHVMYFLKGSIKTFALRRFVSTDYTKVREQLAVFFPTNKLVPFPRRASRGIQGISVCHDLRIHLLVPIIELEGNVYALIRLYHTERLH